MSVYPGGLSVSLGPSLLVSPASSEAQQGKTAVACSMPVVAWIRDARETLTLPHRSFKLTPILEEVKKPAAPDHAQAPLRFSTRFPAVLSTQVGQVMRWGGVRES